MKLKRRSLASQGIVIALILAIALGCMACTPVVQNIPEPTVQVVPEASAPAQTPTPTQEPITHTIMVYMVGSDLESGGGESLFVPGFATMDIAEMLNTNLSENVNLLIYTGGARRWYGDFIPHDKNMIFQVQGNDLKPLEQLDPVSMGEPATLTYFLNYGYERFPADKYGIVLWNHGAGPMIGYGIDERYTTQNGIDLLTPKELDTAFANSVFREENKLEWVGFDACLMSSVETSHMLSNYANYMVASQEVIPASGWDYSFLGSIDGNKTGEDIGKAIIDSYMDSAQYYIETLSLLDLTKTAKVEQAMDGLFDDVNSTLDLLNFSNISRNVSLTKSFGKSGSEMSLYDLVDLYDLGNRLKPQYGAKAEELLGALNEFVVYSKSETENTNGVSVYFPYNNTLYAPEWMKEYDSFDFAPKYFGFLERFVGISNGDPIAEFNISNENPTVSQDNATFSFQLSPKQVQNFARAKYMIVEKTSDGGYRYVHSGSDVVLNETGLLTTSYKNDAIFVNEQSTGDKVICTAVEVERGDGYAVYDIFALLENFTNQFTMDSVVIHFLVDADHPKGVVTGITKSSDNENIPSRQYVDPKDYEYIALVSAARKITYYKNSKTILPFFSWEKTGVTEGLEADIKDGLFIELGQIENKKEMYLMFQIRDTQGKEYSSKLMRLN